MKKKNEFHVLHSRFDNSKRQKRIILWGENKMGKGSFERDNGSGMLIMLSIISLQQIGREKKGVGDRLK